MIPDSKSFFTSPTIRFKFLFVICSSNIIKLFNTGSPAFIMVANCLVKIITSLAGTFVFEPKSKLVTSFFSTTAFFLDLINFVIMILSFFNLKAASS